MKLLIKKTIARRGHSCGAIGVHHGSWLSESAINTAMSESMLRVIEYLNKAKVTKIRQL
jgi:hypothetical protein